MEIDAAIAGRSGPREHRLRPCIEIAGNHFKRDFQFLERLRQAIEARHEGFKDDAGVELGRDRSPAKQIGEGERARPPQPGKHLAALAVERDRRLAHLPAGESGGVSRADDRSDRRAGDRRRPYAKLVENFADEDMHHAAGAAAPKRKTDTHVRRHGLSPLRVLARRVTPARDADTTYP